MQQDSDSLDQTYEGSRYDSSLESNSPQLTPIPGLPSSSRFANLHRNKSMLAIALMAVALIGILGVATLLFSSAYPSNQSAQSKASQAANYDVKSLPLQDVKTNKQLEVGEANRLSVNGQLSVNSSFVIKPSGIPSNPVAGQIYYDQTTNQPYFYNGTQFISLSPAAVPQHVTSLGGASGSIGLGNSLQITGNQLGVSSSLLQAVTNAGLSSPRVNSLQGLTGNVTLNAGPGIGISGTTISNNGVIGLASGSGGLTVTNDGSGNYTVSESGGSGVTSIGGASGAITLGAGLNISGTTLSNSGVTGLVGTANQVSVSSGTGNVTLSLPQDIATNSTPTFGGLTLGVPGSTTGNLNLANSGSVREVILQGLNPSGAGNATIQLPSIAGGSTDTICLLNLANCTATGAAGGDLTGSYPNPTIAKLQGTTLTLSSPGAGQILQVNAGGSIVNQTVSGDITINSSGVTAIGAGKVTNADLVNSSLSVTAGTGLSGGGSVSLGGSSAALNVLYGSGVGTAVQGNTTLICPTGTGNLSGGGNTITLGTGGTCNALTITNSPIFSGTLAVQGAGGLTLGIANTTAGNLVLNNASNAHTTTVQGLASASQNQTITIPASSATSDTVCLLTLANCVGTGGGVTGSGTTNTLAKFTGSNAVGDSGISDDGSSVTIAGGETLVAGTISASTLQSAGTLTITPGGNLTIGATNHQFLLQGNGSSTITASSGGNTTTVGFVAPTAARAINFPNESGTICLQGSVNCGFAAGGSGVTSVDGLTGALTVANSSGVGTTITINNAAADGATKGIAAFNATNFTASSGVINTIQGISTSANVQFASLTLGAGGDLNLSPTGTLFVDTIKTTPSGGGNLSLYSDGAGSNITFNTDGGANSFVFPTTGGTGQVICTSGITCASGGGQAVILEPGTGGGSFQTASANRNAIAVNKTGGTGNLIELQDAGVDAFVIDNAGNTTITTGGVTNGFTIGGALGVNTITPSGALTIGATGQAFTLQGNGSSVITATGGGALTTVGFAIGSGGTAPNGNVTYQFANDNTVAAGTYTVCTTAGNCAGVGGSITGSGTAGNLAKFTGTGAIGNSILTDNGTTATVGGNLAVGTSGASQLSIGVASSASGTLVFNNSSNGNATTLQLAAAPSSPVTLKLPNASGTFAVGATGPLSLDLTTGQLSCATCLTSGGGGGTSGVVSLDGLTGTLTINNSTGSGSAITINNAAADGSTKGIAAFNSTNFTASSGVINTIQDIATGSSPTFSNLILQGATGLTVGSSTNLGKIAVKDGTADGFTSTFSPATLTGNQTITIPNASGTLAVSASGNLSLSALGALTFSNSPTFSGTLTVQGAGGITIGVPGSTTGNLNLANATSAREVILQGLNPSGSGNATVQIPTIAGGTTDTVCLLTAANCVGAGGAVSTTGGTQNFITKYNNGAATQITNSQLYDNGSGVSIGNTGPVGLFNVGTTNQFQVSSGGTVTAVGVNSGAGLLQGTGGLTVTGAANINTSGTANTSIGNATGSFGLTSSGLNVTTGGALSGITTINASGAITAATSSNTINGLIVNGGALSGITGYTQTSGNFTQTYASGANNSAAATWNVTNTNSSATATTVNGQTIALAGTANGNSNANTVNGVNFANITTLANNAFNGLYFGTGYNSLLNYNGTSLISGTGILQSAAVSGTYGNLTGTGALASGSIAAGFGTISTGNNITTTATIQGNIVNATGGGAAIELGGANINTAGTLSNVAYLNQANNFSAANTFSAAGTALSVTNNASIGGTLNGQTISSAANFTGTLTVQGSGGLTLGIPGTTTGNLNLANSTSARQVILQGLNPSGSGNATIQLPSIAGGVTDTVCLLSLGNCAGAAGIAGGDLTGSYPNPTIAKLQGTTLTISSIASGDVLQYNGSAIVNGHITNSNLTAGTFSNITGTGALASGSIAAGFGTISTGNNITTTAALQGGTATLTGANALTLGTASTNTGAIVFKGSGGAGTLTLAGPTTPNVGNFTLSIPAITGNANICTDNSVCVGYAPSSGSGNYIQNGTSPQTADFNITGNGTIGSNLTVNGTALFQNTANSATAFQIQNTAGTDNSDTLLGLSTVYNANNLITNGSFEQDTNGWAAEGNMAISQDATQGAPFGTKDLQITNSGTPVALNGADYPVNMTNGAVYNLSFYAKTAAAFATMTMGWSNDGITNLTTGCNTANAPSINDWNRFNCTFTYTGTTNNGVSYVFIGQNDTTARTYYVDGISLEQVASGSYYKEGTLNLDGLALGDTLIQPAANSSEAFVVANAAGVTGLRVNTSASTISTGFAATFTGAVTESSTVTQSVTNAAALQVRNATTLAPLIRADTTIVNSDTNGSFETSTTTATGYATNHAGVTLTVDTTAGNAYVGNNTGKIVTTASAVANSGVKYNLTTATMASATTYTLSFYAKIPAGGTAFSTLVAGRADNGAAETTCSLNSTTLTTYWQRYTCTFTTGTTSGTPYFFIGQSDAGVAHTYFLDGIQIEAGSVANNYREGKIQLTGDIISPTIFRPNSDSTNAFQIENSGLTTTLFKADTANTKLSVTGQLAVAGGLSTVGLSVPAAPTVTPQGTTGATNYSYAVSALNANGGETLISTATQTTTGNATLSAGNNNLITWTAVPGASTYNIYRTASSGTPSSTGLIGNVLATGTLSFTDTGIAGGAAVPTIDNSGQFKATGTVLLQNTANSTAAFQIQTAGGTNLLVADTTNSQVAIGPSAVPANGVLTVGTNTTAASGGIYLGTDTDLYRSAASTLKTDGSFTIGSALTVGTTATIQGANALTLGTASTNTGAIIFKGSGGAGTLTVAGPTTPNVGNFTLSIPTITANDTICVATLANCTAIGTAGGDLTGSYPNPTIAKLQGTTLTLSSLASGDVLQYNGSAVVNGHITNSNLTAGSFGNITGVGTLTGGLNIASGQTYKINGTDINTAGTLSNVAYLNGTGPQTFTGNNKFTGSGDSSTVAGSGILLQNASNSTNAFEIQSQSGTSNLFIADTTNSRIGLGIAPITTAGSGLLQVGAASSTTAAQGISFGGDAIVNLYRSAASTLKTDAAFVTSNSVTVGNGFQGSRATPTNSALAFWANGDSGGIHRFNVDYNGLITWGPGGSTATDTNLYRSAAGVLTTDGNLVAAGSTALTLGTASTNTGAIVFKGSGGAGTLTLAGPTTPNVGNFTLSIPAITGNANICTDNSVCSGYQATPASGSYLQQVPTTTAQNTVTPTANSVVGLTVNATSGTTAAAAIFNQSQTADGIQLNVTNTSGTETNGILVNRNGTGGTTTNGLSITNALGTTTNGLQLTQSGGTFTNGINFTGTFTNLINAGSALTVTNAGNITAGGTYNTNTFNSNTLQFGAAGTATIDSASGQTLQIGTGANAHNVTIGNTTGTSTVLIQGGVNGSTATVGIQTAASGVINIGTSNTGTTLNLGSSLGNSNTSTVNIANTSGNGQQIVSIGSNGATTSTLTLEAGTGSSALLIGNGATAHGIQIGTGAAVQTVKLGSTNTTSSTTLQGGTSGITLSPAGGSSNQGVLVKPVSDTTAAFQIQNASAGQLLNVDSTNSNITLGGLNSPQLQTWNTTSVLPAALYAVPSVTANGYVYVIGGRNTSGAAVSTTYYARLNANGTIPASGTGSWTTTSTLVTALRDESAAYANGYIYIMGGKNSGATVQKLVYAAKVNSDGSLGSWTQMGNDLTPCGFTGTSNNLVYDGAATAANGYIYVVGGRDDPNAQSIVCYAKAAGGQTSAWAATTALNTNVQQEAVTVANGYMYVLGGWGGASTNQNIVQYAPINANGTIGSWTTSGNHLTTVLCGETSTVENGYLYAIGGMTDSACSTSDTATVQYAQLSADGSTGTWSATTTSLPGARDSHTTIAANGYIYAMGGSTDDTQANAQTSVYYTSVPRLQVGGAVDLVGLGGENLNNGGSGGELTAGNTNIIGTLTVNGAANINQALSVNGDLTASGSALFQDSTNSTTAFQVQNATGSSIFNVDTSNSRVGISNGAPGNLLSIGALTTAASGYQIAVSTGGTTNSGIVVQDVASQSSGNAFQLQNSSGTALATIDYLGNLTVQAATIQGTLTINGHVITAGTAPTAAIVSANIGTAGNGAACSVSGNDQSGEITITTATTGTLHNGDWCTITFHAAFGATPHIVFSGANNPGGNTDPYVDNQSTTSFQIADIGVASNSTVYKYDYIVEQ